MILRHALKQKSHGVCVIDPESMSGPVAHAAAKFANMIEIPWFLFADSDVPGKAAVKSLIDAHGAGDMGRVVWAMGVNSDGDVEMGGFEQMLIKFSEDFCRKALSRLGITVGDNDPVILEMKNLKGSGGAVFASFMIESYPVGFGVAGIVASTRSGTRQGVAIMSDSGSREVTLTVQQSAAVMSEANAVLVVASAGSGKTEVVARRVERLLTEREESFGRVLAVTYTVKAAAELRQRFASRLGGASRRVDTETIHGFCHTLLRQYGTNIGLPAEPELLVRDEDRVELLERWLTDKGMVLPEDTLDVLRELDHARSIGSRAPLLGEWEGGAGSGRSS